jgi:magnesium transporter
MTDQSRPDPSPLQPPSSPSKTETYRPTSSSSRRQTIPHPHSRPYRHGNSSSTSIDSTTFVDHRHHQQSLSRNMSIPNAAVRRSRVGRRVRRSRPDGQYSSDETSQHDEEQEEEDDETMRLMSQSVRGQSFAPWTKPRRPSMDENSRLLGSTDRLESMYGSHTRGTSPPRTGRRSSPSGRQKSRYSHINHPSSVPSSIGSPPFRARPFSLVGINADGEQVSMPLAQRAQRRLTQTIPNQPRSTNDVLIDIDPLELEPSADLSALPTISTSPGHSSTHSSRAGSTHSRRKTYKAEEDVCFPVEEPPAKAKWWPDYEVLEEWAAQESKSLDEGSTAVRNGEGGFLSREGHRKVNEPVMVDGRYRRTYTFPSATPYCDDVTPPCFVLLMQNDDARPYRFTFFTDKLATTIHSPTISELVDEGESFSELFEGENSDCWWLDVTNVTDEEMRTLSRVNNLLDLS